MFGLIKKLKQNGVVGMNDRNYNYIAKLNDRKLFNLVDNKVKTKTLALKYGVNVPNLIGAIEFQYQVKKFLDFIKEHKDFVIKPAQGSGGKGVLVIKEHNKELFTTASGEVLTFNDICQHISNTLSGLYSLGGNYDVALIEELVHFSKIFNGYSFMGVPDVRIIVHKGNPVMAMMRLATKASQGRANLHQGAVGVGIDIKTGETIAAVMNDKPITHHPDTGVELLSLKVPLWQEHLEIAKKAYKMTSLGYLGADIVLDEKKGPMLLELNARPGLAIQIANNKGLGKVL
ncbi:MAG: alpha-L-glutamate ligase-like protein [Alphaproteobacteria bacterium]